MDERYIRTAGLVGEAAVERLMATRVAIFGVGGVGSYVVEALARAGVGALDLIDSDTVARSNINRQIIATESTVGMAKVDAAAARVRDINPDIKVRTHKIFFEGEDSGLDFSEYDYIVDCIDSVSAKVNMAVMAAAAGVPMISSMGTGNKLDPTAFEVADISKTSVCPLARAVRVALRKRGIDHLKVVYSRELPKTANFAQSGDPCNEIQQKTDGRPAPASISFVPSAAGLIIAGEVVLDLIGIKK